MLPGVRPDWGKLAKVSAKPDKGDKYVELLDGFNGMIRELVSENSVLREAIRISGPVFEAQQRFEKEQEVFEKYAGVKSVSEALDKVFATPEAAKQVSVAIHVWVDQSIKKILHRIRTHTQEISKQRKIPLARHLNTLFPGLVSIDCNTATDSYLPLI